MSSRDGQLRRSYLYVPGDRPELFAKAARSGADAIVLDLEDSVADTRKEVALGEVARATADAELAGASVHVRLRAGSAALDDVRRAVGPAVEAVRIPKAEDPGIVAAVGSALDEKELGRGARAGGVGICLIVESAIGLHRLEELVRSHARVRSVAFGETDFLADLGIPDADVSTATLYARSTIVLLSRVHELTPPIDSVWTALSDPEGLREHALRGRALGFFGKSVIHPAQVDVVNAVFTPSDEEVARAEKVVAAAASSSASVVDGAFVDPAVAARAEALLNQAKRGTHG